MKITNCKLSTNWYRAVLLPLVSLSLFIPSLASYASEKRCLIVASYHDEFPGQRLKVQPALDELKGNCEIKKFDMDTKRNPDPEFIKAKALEAKNLIEKWNPNVVIAIEDNASKYLVQPYYKNSEIPFVFAGVDWTADAYGYPYENVTGIIEIVPIRQLIRQLHRIDSDYKKGLFIRPNRLSADKQYARVKDIFERDGIVIDDGVVDDFAGFKSTFLEAQSYDFIYFTNNAGIDGWDDEKAKEFIYEHSTRLVFSTSDWMVPFSMFSFSQVIQEQGQYAAQIAVEILNGAKPSDFPIISNRQWDLYINEELLSQVDVEIPSDLLRKAKKLND
ncbi:ABC transporter substrate-binding protein [Vibrio inusitatus]|nr:ABC transporter substrate binding protein [Vibrio inusitatus]